MGAALGNAKANTASTSPLESWLAQMGSNLMRQTGPVRKQILGQLQEALTTGGVNARIPQIQAAVASSKQALSGGLQQTAEQLASRNIGGPFAARIMGGARMEGQQQISQIAPQMAQQLIGQFMPFAAATQGMGMQTFSTAAQSAQQLGEFNASQRQQQVLQGGLFGGGRIAGIL